MRISILLAHVRGEDAWEFVAGPETPNHEQRAIFKEAKVAAKHPRWDRIELWERGGSVDHVKLLPMDGEEPVTAAPVAETIPAGVSVPPGTVVTESEPESDEGSTDHDSDFKATPKTIRGRDRGR